MLISFIYHHRHGGHQQTIIGQGPGGGCRKRTKYLQQGPQSQTTVRERAPERGPQPSRKEKWATGPKGKRSGEFWRGPASKGLKANWTVERVFNEPLYLLVPPPSPLSPSLPLLLSLFLMTTLYAASFRKSPVITFGYSCCPPTATPATGQYLILCLLPPSQHCGWLRQRPPSY